MKTIKYTLGLAILTMLSSCTLINLGLAYLGYLVVAIVVGAVVIFLFSILNGITNSFAWSAILTFVITLFIMALVFKW